MNNQLIRQLLMVLVYIFYTGSCAYNAQQRHKTMDSEIQQILESSAQTHQQPPSSPSQPPPEVERALLPPLTSTLEPHSGIDPDPRFDITVNNAPAQEFFMSLVQGTTDNMVVHPSVKGDISLTMKNVTIDEVMQTVRDVYGYEYQRKRTGYMVLPRGMQSRIFQVDYLNVSRLGDSKTVVNSGQISESTSSSGESTESAGSVSDSTDLTAEAASRIQTNTKTDFWQELSSALSIIVGTGNGKSVVISPQTGVVVVRAMPAELRDVAQFLNTIGGSLSRQVILEAKILEVTLNDGFQSGINWAGLSEPDINKTLIFGQTGGGDSLGTDGVSEIIGNPGILNPQNLLQVEGTNTSAFGGVFTIAASLNDFNAFIELLKTQGDVRVLSSPRVSTVNNQKAVIKVGTDEFFVTDIESNVVTGTASTASSEVTLTPFFSGIALDVTPQISKDGAIILHMHPSITEVQDQIKTIPMNNDDIQVPLALSNVRESDSIVHTQSGRVVVIGGLMQDKSRFDQASTPLLGDIPGLGNLFKHKRQVATKSELVILLRANVINSSQQWTESLDESAKRFGSIQH